MPYRNWDKCINVPSKRYINFLTGVGGVLYPPNCFYKDIYRDDIFMELAPNADDVWFWAMAVLNHTKIQLSDVPIQNLIYINPARELNLTDDGTLYSSNGCGDNDVQLKNVLQKYPELYNMLQKEITQV